MDNDIRSFKEVFPRINTLEERARQEAQAIRSKHGALPSNTYFCWTNEPRHSIGWFCQHPDCIGHEVA